MPYQFLAKNGLISQGDITATGSAFITQAVGIGTTNPGGKLEIRTDAASNYIFSGSSSSGYTARFLIDDTALYIGHDSSVRSFTLRTNSSDRLTITGGGNVGVGSTSPSSKLEVLTSAVGLANQPNIIGNFRGDTDGRSLIRVDNTSTSAGAAALQAGVSFVAYSNTSNQPSANKHEAQIILGSTGATSVSGGQTGTLQIVAPLDIAFNVSASNTIMTGSSYTTFGSNAMYLARSGNVGIGTTSPSVKLHVSGSSYFQGYANVYVNQINTIGTSGDPANLQVNSINIHPNSTTETMYIRRLNSGNFQIQTVLASANSGQLHLQPYGGSVGIGTTSPAFLLDVSGSSRFGFTSTNTHQFTGSVNINGPLTSSSSRVNGAFSATQIAEKIVTFTPLTGSLTENPAWYRLISGSGVLDSGRVRLSANYDNSRSDLEFTYAVRNYDTDGAGAFINITRASTYNSLFTAIRVIEGTLTTPYAIDVLIGNYLNNTSPSIVTCLYESQFISAVLDTPTYVSASATGSNSNVVKTVYTTYTSGYPRIGPAYSDGLAVATYQGQLSVGYRGNYAYNNPSSNNYALLVSGSVGIGTTTLGEKLTVSGNSYIIGSTGAVGTGLAYYLGDSSNRDISLTRAGTAALAIGRYYPSAWAETVRFTADGNVGIGTSSPNSKLEVAGSSGTAIISVNNTTAGRSGSFGIDSNGVYIRNSNDGDYFDLENASGTPRFRLVYDNNTFLNTTYTSVGSLTSSGSKLSVFGNLSVGSSYGSTAAPSNGAIFEGNVGIGTSSPLAKLHVSSSVAIANFDWTSLFAAPTVGLLVANNSGSAAIRIATLDSNSTHDPYLNFLTSGGQNWSVGVDNSDSDKLKISMAAGFATNEFLTIDNSGNVGIGSTGPGAKLDVVGDLRVKSAGPAIILDTNAATDGRMEYKYNGTRKALIGVDSDNLQISADSGNYLQFRTNNTQRMIINNSGGVGIGTSSPLYLFDLYDTGANSAMMSLRSSGSGNARIYFDAANGDLVGSDYCYVGQDDSTLNFVINTANVAGDIHLQPKWNTSNGKLIVSGSSQFGLSPSSTHQFTGSVIGNFTSSRSVGVGFLGTASWAATATTLSSSNISQFTNDSKYHYHRTDISSLSSSATNIVQPVSTFDYNNATNGPTNAWYNYFSSTHGDYLTSLIANRHRSADWYVAYKEGPVGTPTNPSWYLLLHTGNYNTYAPTLTGTGASGTWSITSSMANALNSANSYTVGSLTSTVQASGATGTLVSYVTPGIYANGSSTGNGIGFVSNTSFANQGAIANIGLHQVSASVNDITAGVYMSIGGWHQNSGNGLPVYIGGGYISNSSSILSVVPTNTAGAGNVGIGTRLPGYKLDVNGDIRAMSGSTIRLQTSAGQERGTFQATDTTGAGGAGLAIATSGGEEIAFKDSTDVNMVIKGTGRVGIGTITPAEMLHISSSNNTQLRLESGADAAVQFVGPDTHSYAIGMDDADDKFKISYNASRTPPGLGTNDRLVIDTSGNVGIGTAVPTAKLHVIGDISSSAQVRAASFYTTGAAGSSYFENLNIGTGIYIEGGANEGIYFGDSNRWIIDTCNAAHTDNADGELHFRDYTNSVTRMLIQYSTGRVGIGTTIPSSSLDVIGDIKASSSTINILGNLNSLRGNVSTYGYNLTGSPSGTGWISVQTFHNALSSGDQLFQLAYDQYNQQKLFTRYSADSGATWSSWKTIINSDALSGTTNYIPKFTGTNSIGNSAIYDSGGNVGIATTAPGAPLDVVGQTGTAILRTTTAISTSYAGLRVYNNLNVGTRSLEIDYAGSSYVGSLVTSGPTGESACVTTTGAYPLVLGTSNTARLTILGGGNVGIGSSNPGVLFDVVGSSVSNPNQPSVIGRFTANVDGRTLVRVVNTNTGAGANALAAGMSFVAYSNVSNQPSANTHEAQVILSSTGAGGDLKFVAPRNMTFYVSSSNVVMTGSAYGNYGNSAMSISTAGNVGIGSASPAYKLDVAGGDVNFSSSTILRFGTVGVLNLSSNANDIYANIRVIRNSSTTSQDGMYIGYDGTGTTSAHLRFYANGITERMRIDASNGNVGIGITNPAAKLSVTGSGTGQMLVGDAGFGVNGNYTGISVNGTLNTSAYNILSSPTDTTLYLNRPSGGNINFRENNSDQMVLLTGGNLGIGTSNPSAKVQISGSANSVLLNVKSPISGNIVYVTGSGAVGINTTTPAYTLQVNGSFAATTKSFVIDHPTKPDKKLVYGSLESPYHGIRLTGRDTLVDGKCVVELPDYISKLIMPETVNIQLTGIKCNKTLYVDDINIKENNFTVAYDKGVFESYKDYDFFWDFTAVRADVPELQTEM